MEKMESGLNARAIDFARIGRLVLRRGEWEGRRIVSEAWIDRSIRPLEGCDLEAFRPRRICYQRAWWLHPEEDGQPAAAGAWGHLGQYIYVFPAEEMVMVRFGAETGDVSWPRIFRALAAAVGPGE